MWQDLGAALALVFVIEGILPFLDPARFRRGLLAAAALRDPVVRGLGGVSMVAGLILLYLVR